MPAPPKLGTSYTREQINAMVGGGVQSFLPTKNGRVVCGCFLLKLTPDAPSEVLVVVGPQRERTAEIAVLQQTPFPIFIERDVGEWEYIGNWRGVRYLDRGHKLLEAEARAKRTDVAGSFGSSVVQRAAAAEFLKSQESEATALQAKVGDIFNQATPRPANANDLAKRLNNLPWTKIRGSF